MNPLNANAQELADLIQRRFAAHPIPSYPPLMGLDPPGERDEYAAFANVAWPDVPPENFRWTGYDICPAIGFLECSRMWNYYFPGFMTASLLHEDRFDVIDGFVWRLREIAPPAVMGLGDPWWGGDTLFANFARCGVGRPSESDPSAWLPALSAQAGSRVGLPLQRLLNLLGRAAEDQGVVVLVHDDPEDAAARRPTGQGRLGRTGVARS